MDLLFNFFSSQTIGLAWHLIPILSTAFTNGHPDQWVFDHLPGQLKQGRTLVQLQNVISTGQTFMKAVYDFVHKPNG